MKSGKSQCIMEKRNAPKHSKTTKYPSYKGLVMAGYQGWFHQPGKGVMYPDGNSVRIDMWPDVSEYEKTYPTGQKLADGSTARFFSSTDESTVDLHFKWMQEYGLDASLIKAGLLDSLTIYTVPVMAGKGIGFVGETSRR